MIKTLHKIIWPNSLKTVPSGVANCRNLPFDGRATHDLRVRLLRKEYARSRHQRLFEENVRKTGKRRGLRTLNERFGSCIYARGRYQHPTRPSQETATFNQMCKYDFNLCSFPFLRSYVFFMPFYVFIFLWSTSAFPIATMYSSIVMRKSELLSSF